MIPTPTRPLGVNRYVFLHYIERDITLTDFNSTDHDWRDQLWLNARRLTSLGNYTIRCGFSTVHYDDPSNAYNYPIFFGTWRLKDGEKTPGEPHPYFHYINYLGGNQGKFFLCQRLGNTRLGTMSNRTIPADGTPISAVITGSSATITANNSTLSFSTTPQAVDGNYGYPVICNMNSWRNRFYYYHMEDGDSHLDCVPAFDKVTSRYGMYDKGSGRFRGNKWMTGA